MRQVRQLQLLPSDEFFAESDDNTRLMLVLNALPDAKLLAWLRECRRQRRDDYPYEVLWRCLAAKSVYRIEQLSGARPRTSAQSGAAAHGGDQQFGGHSSRLSFQPPAQATVQ